jgi:hypothetical protein
MKTLVALLLLGVSPGWAMEACFSAGTGDWHGPVFSGGHLTMMDTEFHGAGGVLEGSYYVHDKDSYGGTLTGFRQTAPCTAEFDWNDKFGTGVVEIRFEPQYGQFFGLWGMVHPMYEHIFDGFRLRPDLQS